jgi:uncharacterized protein YgbK (DUF1537 family)
MKDHPLTPMRDANLVNVLRKQTSLKVGLVSHDSVSRGVAGIATAYEKARQEKQKILIVDAITDEQLRAIGTASHELKLITGGAGIAMGLPDNFRREGRLAARESQSRFEPPIGAAVILAGSCSTATRRQIARAAKSGTPTLKIDPIRIADGEMTVKMAVDWVMSAGRTSLVYSSTAPEEVLAAQTRLGRDNAGTIVEDFLAEVAVFLRQEGYSRFLIAGGETSGAVVKALGVEALFIGPEIDPGVPWTRSIGDERPVALALKSGNFGTDDFLIKAWDLLQ